MTSLKSRSADISPRRTSWAIGGFILLGVALRLARYALNYPLWSDEAFVAANFLRRGYLDLLKPLDYWQICPVLFLWGERAAVSWLGFTEWSLRLIPLLCAILAMGLFPRMAACVTERAALLLAVGIFAVSAGPIRHASEVKAYAGDLLVALCLLTPALAWLRERSRTRLLWLLGAIAPIALASSHPAVFVAGGISLGLSGAVWKERRRESLVPFAAFNAAVAVSFALLFLFVMRGQDAALPSAWRSYWDVGFPPLKSPLAFLRWLLEMHTGEMFGHPGGGGSGASAGTFLLFILGAVALWRQHRRAALATLLGPFALTFMAAALRKYPYGGAGRHLQFLAPSICVLAGIGAADLIERLRSARGREWMTRLAAAGLVVGGFVLLGRSIQRPYYHPYDVSARAFARDFWPAQGREAEVVCPLLDRGIRDADWVNMQSAFYQCNQAIYSPRHGRADWNAVSPSHPLRVMLYPGTSLDNPEFVAWLGEIRSNLELRRVDDLPLTMLQPSAKVEHLLIFEYAPKAGPDAIARSSGPISLR